MVILISICCSYKGHNDWLVAGKVGGNVRESSGWDWCCNYGLGRVGVRGQVFFRVNWGWS